MPSAGLRDPRRGDVEVSPGGRGRAAPRPARAPGRRAPRFGSVDADGTVVVGTPAGSPADRRPGSGQHALGPRRRGLPHPLHEDRRARATVIASNGEAGALYGAFHFLRLIQTGQPIDRLDVAGAPALRPAHAEPLGQPRRQHRARLRGPLAVELGRAAGPRRPAGRSTTRAPTPRSASTAPCSTT